MNNHIRIFIKLLLCTTILFSSCNNRATPSATLTPNAVQAEDLKMFGDYGQLSPPEIARELELRPVKTYEDYIDLGTSYLWMGKYLEAAEAYEFSARQANTTSRLVGALYIKAAALAYVELSQAVNAIELAARLQPDNIEVAWLRYALYRYTGDSLGMNVAIDQLVTLDPSLSGKEILGVPEVVIITIAVVIVLTAPPVIAIALTPPEDRKDIVPKVMESFYQAIGEVAKSSLPPFGRYLVELIK